MDEAVAAAERGNFSTAVALFEQQLNQSCPYALADRRSPAQAQELGTASEHGHYKLGKYIAAHRHDHNCTVAVQCAASGHSCLPYLAERHGKVRPTESRLTRLALQLVHEMLAQCLMELEQYEHAHYHAQAAVSLQKAWAQGYLTLGRAARGSGKLKEAAASLKQCLNLCREQGHMSLPGQATDDAGSSRCQPPDSQPQQTEGHESGGLSSEQQGQDRQQFKRILPDGQEPEVVASRQAGVDRPPSTAEPLRHCHLSVPVAAAACPAAERFPRAANANRTDDSGVRHGISSEDTAAQAVKGNAAGADAVTVQAAAAMVKEAVAEMAEVDQLLMQQLARQVGVAQLRVQEQHGGVGGLGGVVWDAGVMLARYLTRLELQGRLPGSCWTGQYVLELGSGTGLVGIVAAMLGAQVLLTDLPEVLPLLQHNVQRNQEAIAAAGGSADCAVLDWNQPPALLLSRSLNVVIGADLVYNVHGLEALQNVVQQLVQQQRKPAGVVDNPRDKFHNGYPHFHEVSQTGSLADLLQDSQGHGCKASACEGCGVMLLVAHKQRHEEIDWQLPQTLSAAGVVGLRAVAVGGEGDRVLVYQGRIPCR